YSLSLGYGLTFLLLGAWMLAGLHLDRTARLVRGTLQAAGPVTAGQVAPFTLQLAGLSTRLVGCINYSLSLGYGLTFLLLGAWMLAGLHLDRTARLVRG
ncbi:hypothetical protein CTI14_61255, partial [Methylobacterium radiotolerans]